MTQGGAATLYRPVLLYTFVMAAKECERGMIIPVLIMFTVGIRPTEFKCKTTALTSGSLTVPDILLLRDHD